MAHVTFLRDFVTPYLSSVYKCMIEQSGEPHLTVNAMRFYFNLPEVVFTRVLKQINPSGDNIIDHDEWLKFFLRLTCGSFQ